MKAELSTVVDIFTLLLIPLLQQRGETETET